MRNVECPSHVTLRPRSASEVEVEPASAEGNRIAVNYPLRSQQRVQGNPPYSSACTASTSLRPGKPEWLKVKAPGSPSYLRLKGLMRDLNLHTVCEEARCPNIGECWTHGTATFMILGDICTRACGYCAVGHGRPHPVDTAEPARVADAVATLDLAHVVVTSVDRDDVSDGGASIFAETIREIRSAYAVGQHRSADSGFSGEGRAALRRAGCRPRHPEPQHGNGAPPVSARAVGRPL